MDIDKLREQMKAMDTTPPEGYLEGLEDRVLQTAGRKGRRVVMMRVLSAAASIAILVVASVWWIGRTGEGDIYSQISDDVLAMHYVETYEDDWMIEDDWLDQVSVDEMVDLLEADGADEDVYAFMNKMME